MAEILSTELFDQFLWSGGSKKTTNVNWACVREDHDKKTHPSDVVFWYDQPYSARKAYINCDLKSYAKGSINANNIGAAIESLAQSVACAAASSEWRDLFVSPDSDAEIIGMLFVYNHDGDYDKDFDALLQSALRKTKVWLPKHQRIVVFGPKDIYLLNNIVLDIKVMKGEGAIPVENKALRYFFPNLIRRKLSRTGSHRAATVEMLSAPWISLEYETKDKKKELLLYYKGKGEDPREFIYLLDYLLSYQVTETFERILIRYLGDNAKAKPIFSNAIEAYVNQHVEFASRDDAFRMVEFGSIRNFKTSFSDIEIGMTSNA